MVDLLPPSPFLSHSRRASPPDPVHAHHPLMNPSASSSTSSLQSTSSLPSHAFGDSVPSPSRSHFRSRSYGVPSSQVIPANPLNGPYIPPLDFNSLTQSHDKTHIHLAKTVETLSQWLAILDHGLSQALEQTAHNVIQEEQEPDDQTTRTVAKDSANGAIGSR
ncbi:hypothetical protein K474DRAFT_86640 [Panus rudis PR-1116 ss-1]|nr:hypothetical protein K474DRAFT_86640 [Panus rudis PR-1116 ss-1]